MSMISNDQMRIRIKPYTKKELDDMLETHGKIEAIIAINLDEVIKTCDEGFLDMLDDYITNGYGLGNITYKPVGVTPEGRILLYVTGTEIMSFDDDF